MTEAKIRILVVEDHTVVRKGLCALLSSERYGCEVVGEAADGVEAVAKAAALKPDVILMDLIMPRMGGIEATHEICQRDPKARVLVLTSFDDQARVSMALQVGALGYMLKDSSPDELVHAIRSVHLGRVTVLASCAADAVRESPSSLPPNRTLRPRLKCCVPSPRASNQEIADTLSISGHTVRSDVRKHPQKLNFSNRTQAAAYAIEIGLAKPGGV